MKPSMYSILHSTGVCVKCQSDFSGLKSKTHGICHLEGAFQKVTSQRVLTVATFTIKSEYWQDQPYCMAFNIFSCQTGVKCNSSAQAQKEDFSPSPIHLHCDSSRIVLHWLHFRVIAGSQSAGSPTLCLLDCHSTEVVMSSPCLSALASQDMAIT